MSLDPQHLFHDIEASHGLVVAISGGSDSLALLLLLHDFLSCHPSPPPLLAVTVDHGLRLQSADEAAGVAALCQARGIAHRTLIWQGDKPSTGVIAAAREARYALLAQAAADFGANIILTGHTLDDQAETLAMRAARGDGVGLSGMAKATLFDRQIWIVRPFLTVRRQALRDWLCARNIVWVDDPSNENLAYERVRMRKRLNDVEIISLGTKARKAGADRTALAMAAAEMVGRYMTRPAPGLYRLERELFDTGSQAAAVLALRAALATIGAMPRLPDLAGSQALFTQLSTGKPMRATLSRTLVDARSGGIFLRREARDLPRLVLDGKPAIWDGRLRVEGPAGLIVAALGEAAMDISPSLVRSAMAVEPGLFRQQGEGEDLIGHVTGAAAASCGVVATPLVAPFSRFLPGFDSALAQALGEVVEASPLAALPLNNHIRTEA